MNLKDWFKVKILGHTFTISEGSEDVEENEQTLSKKTLRNLARCKRIKQALEALETKELQDTPTYSSLKAELMRREGELNG